MLRFQFTLLQLFIFISAACLLAGAAHILGVWLLLSVLIWLIVCAALTVGWAAACLVMPEAAKYATVYGLIGTLLLSLLSMGLLRAREQARRSECSRRLHLIADKTAARRDFYRLPDTFDGNLKLLFLDAYARYDGDGTRSVPTTFSPPTLQSSAASRP
jgi:hypothetical protein